MNRTPTVPVALSLTLSLAVAMWPVRARAASPTTDNMTGLVLLELGVLGAGGTLVIAGVSSDIGMAVDLAATGHVARGLAVTGTVAWSALTLIDVFASYDNNDPGGSLANPGNLALTTICVGSLAWSIYALTRGWPPVAVAPTAVVTPDGHAAAGLVVAGRF